MWCYTIYAAASHIKLKTMKTTHQMLKLKSCITVRQKMSGLHQATWSTIHPSHKSLVSLYQALALGCWLQLWSTSKHAVGGGNESEKHNAICCKWGKEKENRKLDGRGDCSTSSRELKFLLKHFLFDLFSLCYREGTKLISGVSEVKCCPILAIEKTTV